MNDSFNYVAVLVSIVVGLGVTRVLSQISEVIQAGSRPQTYWIHTVWLINAFSMLMLNWWVFYRWHNAPEWTFFLFVWVTLAPTLMYLASSVIAPGELAETGAASWRDYFYSNRRGFFFIIAPIWPLDIIDTLLKGKQLDDRLPDRRNFEERAVPRRVGDPVSSIANLLHYDSAPQTRLIRTIDGFARSNSE